MEGQKAKCKYCEAVISIKRGNVCNMNRHLKAKHPEVLEESQPTTPVPSFSNTTFVPIDTQKSHEEAEILISDDESSASTEPVVNVCQEEIIQQDSMDISFPEPMPAGTSSQINQQLVRMIVTGFQPLSIVEQVEFKKFVNMLNTQYVLPSRKTLSNSHIPKLYESVKRETRAKLSQTSAVSITTDMWTLKSVQSFLSVTAHFIDEDSCLNSALLECIELPQSHTADDICRDLKRIFSDWDVANKITAVVTDNSDSIISAVQKGNWCHLPSFIHSLNSVVQDALLEIGEVRSKCKSLLDYFKKCPRHSHMLSSIQKDMNVEPLELKQDVATRWNSTYDMLTRILATKAPIEASLSQLGTESILNYTDWKIIERGCDILRVFDAVATEMSSEMDATLSKVILLINRIRTFLHEADLKNEPEEIIVLISKLLEGTNKHFSYLDDNQLVLETTLLDPRFKAHAFLNKTVFKKAYQLLSGTASEVELPQEVESPLTEASTNSFWFEFDEMVRKESLASSSTEGYLVELGRYMQETIVRRSSDPLTWWRERKVYYPRLYRIMKERLCIVPSVPSERVFTKSGMLICERQGKVSSLKVSQMVFLKCNLK